MAIVILVLVAEGIVGFLSGFFLTILDSFDREYIYGKIKDGYKKCNWLGYILYSLLLILGIPVFISIEIGHGIIVIACLLYKWSTKAPKNSA